ncbi:MAG: pitrilysin family protein [Candidatus Marinimicrobia bacterium]|jgi:zinc protease|nr:pitrilysin family protein [Candidatus Neomarinimicrobiota bacterium]
MDLIAPQINDVTPVDGVRVLSLETGVRDVVTITGSLLGGEVFSPDSNSAVAEMTASMLDQGTEERDKFAISETLENVGAALTFSSDNYRVRFGARCLSKDVGVVLELLAEQLRTPAFKKRELDTLIKRRVGELKKHSEDTRARAMEAFLQTLYPEDHPNFYTPMERQLAETKAIRAQELKKFHGDNYGTRKLTIVAVGDVNHEKITGGVKRHFSGWQMSPLSIARQDEVVANTIGEPVDKTIEMKGKTSADTVFGQPIGIDRDHEEFHPLMLGHFILGGNFSARLMSTVRDQEGLTYGIQAIVAGVDNGNDGYWYVWGTFAPELTAQGRKSAVKQLKKWIENGVTEDELARKKTTIGGMYRVGLATTAGLAGRILTTVERGRTLDYIDSYPDRIGAITLDQVNKAIRGYCDSGKLVTVVAGATNK